MKALPRTELLLARAYQRTGDGEAAHRMLEKARHSAPNNPEVVRAVASYYRDTGQYAEAVQFLEDLHAKDPARSPNWDTPTRWPAMLTRPRKPMLSRPAARPRTSRFN